MTLRQDVAGWPISRWQDLLRAVYGNRNATWSVEAIWHRMLEEIGELVVPMAHISFSRIQWELPDIFAWLCAAATRLSDTSLDDVVWAKFRGGCPGCGKYEDCSCPDVGAAISSSVFSQTEPKQPALFHVSQPACVDEWQEFFGKMYGKRNADTQPLFLLGRLTEDVGRISRSLRLRRPAAETEPRLASIFAWLCGICHRYSATYAAADGSSFRLSLIMYEKYRDTCAKCHQVPCACKLPLRTVAFVWPEDLKAFGVAACTLIEKNLRLDCVRVQLEAGSRHLGARVSLMRAIESADVCIALVGGCGEGVAEAVAFALSRKGQDSILLTPLALPEREDSATELIREFQEHRASVEFSDQDTLVSATTKWLSVRLEENSDS